MQSSLGAVRRWGALLARRQADVRGASLVEYALLVALIAVVCVVAVVYLGGEARESFSRTGASVDGA